MQRAEDQVPCQGGAYGDIHRLHIAHFTDHDDIGIASQDASQRTGKGKVDFRFDGDLNDSVDLVFHGILDGHDAAFLHIERAEKSVE